MSIENIKVNASPSSKRLARELEVELSKHLDEADIRELFRSSIHCAFVALGKMESGSSTDRFNKAKKLLDQLAGNSNPDALPLSHKNLAVQLRSESSTSHTLLFDVNKAQLFGTISSLLGAPYLSECSLDLQEVNPITGVLYGECARPMVALPCQVDKGVPRLVIFVVDSSTLTTELSPRAMEAVCGTESIPGCVHMLVYGVKIEVKVCNPSSRGYHRDVSVLGKNFFLCIRAQLLVDYEELTCSITARHKN